MTVLFLIVLLRSKFFKITWSTRSRSF